MLPLIVASMEGLRMVSHAETEVLQRAFKLHNLVCNTDDHDQHCFPRIAAKAGLGSLPPPVYLCSGGQPCSDATMQFLRLPANAPVTSGEETVTVPPLFPVQNVVAACEPTPWLTPEKIAAMFKFVDRNGFVVTGTARVCAESCENFFAENNVSLGDGDVIGLPLLLPRLLLLWRVSCCSSVALWHAADPWRAHEEGLYRIVVCKRVGCVTQRRFARGPRHALLPCEPTLHTPGHTTPNLIRCRRSIPLLSTQVRSGVYADGRQHDLQCVCGVPTAAHPADCL